MEISAYAENRILHILLDGEIDEHNAVAARIEADGYIDENALCEKVYFHLGRVSFMDSTGIGFLIGRYKKLQRYGMKAYVVSPNQGADKVLSLSGIYTLIPKLKTRKDY